MSGQVKEVLAILMVGDGVIGQAALHRHSLLWKFDPEFYRRIVTNSVKRSVLVRLMSEISVGAGLWLALSQYKES